MKLKTPETTSIVSTGLWINRKKIQPVFVRRHNLDENLKAIQEVTAENEVSLSPKDWLLLLEGKNKYHARENLYLDAFTEEFKIQSEDPITPPFTGEIANIADIEKTLAALSVLVIEYLDFIDQNENVEEENLKRFLDETLHAIAKGFDISPKQLQNQFINLKWDTSEFWQDVELFRTKREQLIGESNIQSRNNLGEHLRRSYHPNIFILSGIAHKPVFVH